LLSVVDVVTVGAAILTIDVVAGWLRAKWQATHCHWTGWSS